TDAAGNSQTVSRQFNIDVQAPSVTITSPTNGTYTNNSNLPINYTISDLGGVGLSQCWWTRDNGLNNYTIGCSGNSVTGSITGQTWSEGLNTVKIYAKDSLGNENSATVQFYLDTIAPLVNITGPATNGTWYNTVNVIVNFTVNDASPVTCNWTAVGGTPSTGTLSSCSNNGGLNQITVITWNQGSVSITITVTDAAGNSQTVSRQFNIDVQAPSVTITSPTNGTYTNNSNLPINYTISDLGGVGLSQCWWTRDNGLNNYTIGCSGNSVTGSITGQTWSEGLNTVKIYAKDSLGNENSATVQFYLDTIAPLVNITGPATNGTWYNTVNVIVNFTVNDASPVTCNWTAVNGTPSTGTLSSCSNNGGLNQITGITWNQGSVSITITVTDAAGNSQTVSRQFNIDVQAPSVTITSPTNGFSTNNKNLPVHFTISDTGGSGLQQCLWTKDNGTTNESISCSGNSVTGSITGQTWSEGWNYVTIFAKDAAGNLANSSVQFFVDSVAPVITVISPIDNSYHNVSSILLQFNVSDALSNVTNCYWTLDGGTTNEVDCSTGSATVNLSSLSEGSHNVVIAVKDSLNNIQTKTVVFTIDLTAPSLAVIGPALDDIYFNIQNLVINFSVSDNIALNNTCWYYHNNNNVPNYISCSGGQISGVNWPDGWNNITLFTKDLAGNHKSASRRFYINGSAHAQTLNLVTGWNLISFNLTHLNATPKSVLAPIIDKVTVVRGYYNGTWTDWTPSAGGSITEFKPGYAYFVNVTQNTQLTVVGYQETVTSSSGGGTPIYPFQINVTSGWNLLGVYVNSTISGFPNSLTINQVVYPFQNGVPVLVASGTGLPIPTPNGYNTVIAVGQGFWMYSSTNGAYWPKV
ncbi:MAG: Ig-like domain-containing protein, partial [Candidatus Micrarchaeota archaeon]|nr:Ig-like domain-containing protein [Candidatus Micrarchaeota archaeon]